MRFAHVGSLSDYILAARTDTNSGHPRWSEYADVSIGDGLLAVITLRHDHLSLRIGVYKYGVKHSGCLSITFTPISPSLYSSRYNDRAPDEMIFLWHRTDLRIEDNPTLERAAVLA